MLVAPTVFVTAGHCSGLVERFGLDKAWVSFASEFDASTSPLLAIGAAHTAFTPDFGVKGLDLGVLVLAEPVGGVTPASLPREGLLDELLDARTLADSEFTNVGYGSCGILVGDGPPTFCPGGIRRVSTSPFMALNAAWLRLQANHTVTGEGGTCFDDSGGPSFSARRSSRSRAAATASARPTTSPSGSIRPRRAPSWTTSLHSRAKADRQARARRQQRNDDWRTR